MVVFCFVLFFNGFIIYLFLGKGNISVKTRVWSLWIFFYFIFFCILPSSLSRKLSIGSVSELLVGLSKECLLYTLSEGFIIVKL